MQLRLAYFFITRNTLPPDEPHDGRKASTTDANIDPANGRKIDEKNRILGRKHARSSRRAKRTGRDAAWRHVVLRHDSSRRREDDGEASFSGGGLAIKNLNCV